MNKLLKWVYKKRAKYYADRLLPFISLNERVLDVGSGTGNLAELIINKAKVTLVDLVDYNQTELPLILYNGKKLPFEDNSFDTALLIAVLHHTSSPEKLLEEVKRVSKRIIVIEEVYNSIFGRLFLDVWEWFWNMTSGIATFYNFHSNKEWKEIFRDLDLKIITNEKFRSSLKTLTMNLFILENKKSNVKRGL